jgi:hypothetical protein
MRRTLLTRALAAIMAVWLALVLGEPAALHHRCPMHDGPAPAAVDAVHAGHESHAPSSDHGGHGCTCIGTCSAAGGIAALVANPGAVVALESRRVESPTPDHRAAPDARRAFALPFANGPPLSPIA